MDIAEPFATLRSVAHFGPIDATEGRSERQADRIQNETPYDKSVIGWLPHDGTVIPDEAKRCVESPGEATVPSFRVERGGYRLDAASKASAVSWAW